MVLKLRATWEEIFGKSELKTERKDWQFYSYYTEELFMAWNYAKYVEKVTAKGKAEYPIAHVCQCLAQTAFNCLAGKISFRRTFAPGYWISGGLQHHQLILFPPIFISMNSHGYVKNTPEAAILCSYLKHEVAKPVLRGHCMFFR